MASSDVNDETAGNERLAWLALALGLVAPWWLPFLSQPIATFYKEWLFVVAFAFAGLVAAPLARDGSIRARLHPLALAALACIGVLIVQGLFFDGVWRRVALMGFAAAFFVFAMALGLRILEGRGDDSLAWIAKCLIVAALGSCLFAAAQLALPGLPFVLPLVGDRLFGNVGQANHFADLLWIGSVATGFLYARGTLGRSTAAALVVTMQAFAATSGSRMAWVYAAVFALLAALCWLRRPQAGIRRFAGALVALVVIYVVVTATVSASGALEAVGLASAEHRVAAGVSEESTAQRLWLWRVGLGAAVDHPLLGVGAGRFPGEGLALAMRGADMPKIAADSQAHNIFIQLAAECGIPLALFVAGCLVVWLTRVWRTSSGQLNAMAAIAMAIPILVHANLEHPLGYLYFLGLLGLLVGLVPAAPAGQAGAAQPRASPELLRFASFAVLAAAALAYVQYAQVERATLAVSAQLRAGAPPQPSQNLNDRLAAIPRWSIFGDYGELIALIVAVPTQANAKDLAQRCERSLALGPSPQLLARCATALQVAGQTERASYFANSLCKLFPDSVAVLIQSMSFVEPTTPAVADLRSTCVRRVDAAQAPR
jgi:O-antigen ligase